METKSEKELTTYELKVNGTPHTWPERCIRGEEIVALAGVEPAAGLKVFQWFAGNFGRLVEPREQADLMTPGAESFRTILVPDDGPVDPSNIVIFHVDNELYAVGDVDRSVKELLDISGNGPAEDYYLLEFKDCGAIQEPHKDPDEVIRLDKGMRFAAIYAGCMPVSFLTGPEAFEAAMAAVRCQVDRPPGGDPGGWRIVKGYRIPAGAFAGRIVDIAAQVPADFPATPPGGLYVSPTVVPRERMGQIKVHDRPGETAHLPGDYQYWSRPIPEGSWQPANPGRRLISHWNAVFADVN